MKYYAALPLRDTLVIPLRPSGVCQVQACNCRTKGKGADEAAQL